MALTLDPSATFDQMHAEVQDFGTPAQKKLGLELKYGHDNVGVGIEVSLRLHREAMAELLEDVRVAK